MTNLTPRGCSTSEYEEYLKAVEEYDKTKYQSSVTMDERE